MARGGTGPGKQEDNAQTSTTDVMDRPFIKKLMEVVTTDDEKKL